MAMSSRLKIVLFFVILLFPAVLGFATAKVSFSRAESVEFCGSCHTMQPWIDDVTASGSESVAGAHFAHRWIQRDQCYSCHSNYSFLGPMKAKVRGVEHVVAFYLGNSGPIHLYEEFPNENCLQCHQQAKGFLEESGHEPIEDLVAGKERCVECHDLHDVEQESDGDDAEPADGEEEGDAGDGEEDSDAGDGEKDGDAGEEPAQEGSGSEKAAGNGDEPAAGEATGEQVP